MKRIFLLICVVSFIQLEHAVSQTIRCENIGSDSWGGIGEVRTCIMEYTTTIETDAVSISPSDSSVLGLSFAYNKNILFLPIKLDESFPTLLGYAANSCSIKTASKINFRNLKHLKELRLHHNQVEIINSDTFEDLTSLEVLWLNDNKIKQMNGAAFERLSSLRYVWLNRNICIDRYYANATAIAKSLMKDVNENCTFEEPELKSSLRQTNEHTNRIESLTKENRELSVEVAALKTKLATAESFKLQLEVTNGELLNENAALKTAAVSNLHENLAMNASLRSALESKLQIDDQLAMKTSQHAELKKSWDLVSEEQKKEITECLDEKSKLQAEVNEKKTQIENLEKSCST